MSICRKQEHLLSLRQIDICRFIVTMKKKIPFIGRQKELKQLEALTHKKVPTLMVIKGRRRVGKSRLVKEFAKDKNTLSFMGLAPTSSTTAQDQRQEFARQLSNQLNLFNVAHNDWGNLFEQLARETQNKKVIILLDEISWMGSKDPTFLSKLKTIWDESFSHNPNLILILCGSVSSWIDKNILSSTGFFGRVAAKIHLEPLNLEESYQLLDKIGFKQSAYEKLTLLNIMGGIPRYLELINPIFPAMENIKQLCFTPNGALVNEFERIFHDLFSKRSDIYQRIVFTLENGPQECDAIANKLNYSNSGQLSEYLDELVQAGFLSRDYTWHLSDGKDSKLSRFRLSDNFLRFYLKCISPNLKQIERGQFENADIASLPGLASRFGLQFENLVLANRNTIIEALNINMMDIISDNPFFQRKTQRAKGCQIDYLIQTKQRTLYLCEIKFSQAEISPSVVEEVKQKIAAIQKPSGMNILPVLIYAGELSDGIIESDFFYRTLNFGQY